MRKIHQCFGFNAFITQILFHSGMHRYIALLLIPSTSSLFCLFRSFPKWLQKLSQTAFKFNAPITKQHEKFMFKFWHQTHFENHIRKAKVSSHRDNFYRIFHLVFRTNKFEMGLHTFIQCIHTRSTHNFLFDVERQIWSLSHFWVSVN